MIDVITNFAKLWQTEFGKTATEISSFNFCQHFIDDFHRIHPAYGEKNQSNQKKNQKKECRNNACTGFRPDCFNLITRIRINTEDIAVILDKSPDLQCIVR